MFPYLNITFQKPFAALLPVTHVRWGAVKEGRTLMLKAYTVFPLRLQLAATGVTAVALL
jgi:hypothetical protein